MLITIIFLIDPILNKILLSKINDHIGVESEFRQSYLNLNEIKEDSNIKMLFLGSSMTREAIDCNQIELELENHSCYNFGISADMPYLRLIELPIIIEMDPDYVLIELAPNAFVDPSCEIYNYQNKKACYSNIQMRFGLASIYQNNEQKETSFSNIINEHKRFIINNKIEEISFWDSYRLTLYNKVIRELVVSEPYNLKVPSIYDSSLSELEVLSDLNSFYNSSGWIPVNPSNSTNLESLIVIIDALLSKDIEIIFYSPPINPIAINALPSNHWNFYNASITLLDERYDLPTINTEHNKWDREEFIDITHLNQLGRTSFSKLIVNHFELLNKI